MNEDNEHSSSYDEQGLSHNLEPKVLLGKAIGANSDYLSAQSFIAQSDDRTFLYIIAGAGEESFTQVRRVGLDCRDNFFNQENDISQTISQVSEFIKTELASLEKLQAVLLIVKNNISYISIIGGGQIYLLRHGRVIHLSKNFSFQKLISGVMQPGDQILLINDRFTDLEDEPWDSVFLQDLIDTPVDQLEEEVESYLQRFHQTSPIAVASLIIPEPAEDVEESRPVNYPQYEPHKYEKIRPNLKLNVPMPTLRVNIKGKRERLILVVLAVVLLVLGILFFTNYKNNSQKNAQVKTFLTQSKRDLDRAVSLKDSDQVEARVALGKAKQELQSALKIDPKSGDAKKLQDEIVSQSGQILKEFPVANFPIFLDLVLVKPDFSTQKFSYSLGKIAALDTKQKTLIMVDVATKNPKILAGQLQLGDAQLASINGDQIFVYSKDKGIVSVDVGNSKAEVVVKPDAEWQRISDIFGFANNIYLLDEFKNQVWKYIATNNGFSERNNYLRDDATADFAGIRKMQIDGRIWVLKSDNTILKFSQGGNDFFSFKDFDVPIEHLKSFFISDETDNMYFLDNDNSRVVVTKKDGQYLQQYSGGKFKTADDLAVDEVGKKLYLLESGKIFQVDLQ